MRLAGTATQDRLEIRTLTCKVSKLRIMPFSFFFKRTQLIIHKIYPSLPERKIEGLNGMKVERNYSRI